MKVHNKQDVWQSEPSEGVLLESNPAERFVTFRAGMKCLIAFLWVFWWKFDCFKYLGTLFASIEWNYELWKVVSTHHELPKNVLVDEFCENGEVHSPWAWAFKVFFDGKFVNLILNCVLCGYSDGN